MPRIGRFGLAVCLLLTLAASRLPAQLPALEDRPTPHVPKQPVTRQELDRREALTLYAQACLRQREDRLLEAVRLLEQARDLDPDGPYISKALVPLYLALCRTDDALASCRKVLDLDPGDYDTWYLYARQLKEQGRTDEALIAYGRAVACAGIKDHPDLAVQVHYDQGLLYEEVHEYAKAEAAFRAVAKVLEQPDALLDAGRFDPDQIKSEAAKTYESIGRVCTQAKRYEQAVAAYRKACALEPERSARLNYNLAKVLVAEGKPGPALEALDAYLRSQPQGIEAHELKIALLKQLGRGAEVVPSLKAQAERDTHNVPLQLLLARAYGEAGLVGEAERLYRALAVESPVPEVYRGLFELYRAKGRVYDALLLLDATLTKGEGDKSTQKPPDAEAAAQGRAMLAVLRDDADLGKALVTVAWAQWRRGHRFNHQTCFFLATLAGRAHLLAQAEQFYRECLNDPFVRQENEFDFYDGLIRVLTQQRKFKDVEAVCRQGLHNARGTTPLLLHVALAEALARQDRTKEAIEEADAADKEAFGHNRLYCCKVRVQVLLLAGQSDKAVAACQEMLKEFPDAEDQRQVRSLLSGCYSDAKDYAHAEEQLRGILKDYPDDAGAHNDLGYLLADQGKNLDEAERLIRRAIDLDRKEKRSDKAIAAKPEGDNFAYLDSLGWVLFRRGHPQEALTWLEKAASDEDGNDPVVWDHLGDVYSRLDQPAKAASAWQKAIDLYEKERTRRRDERYEEVKRKLKLLKSDSHP